MHHPSTNSTVEMHHAASISVWAYWPIALIYIITALLSLYTVPFHVYPDYTSHLMGWVLIFFGVIKLSDLFSNSSSSQRHSSLCLYTRWSLWSFAINDEKGDFALRLPRNHFKLPLSTITIIEASFMILMCIWMLVMFNSMTMVM